MNDRTSYRTSPRTTAGALVASLGGFLAAMLPCAVPAQHAGHGNAGTHEAHRPFDDPASFTRSWDDPARDAWQRPKELVAALGLRPGMSVADIGTGTGYLLPHLARSVGSEGKVFAVDVSPQMLGWVRDRARREGLANVETIAARAGATGLPAASLDRAIMINVWHHIEDPSGYARDLFAALRPGGRLFIVEARPDAKQDGGPPAGMRLQPAVIIETLQKAGFKAAVDSFALDRQFVVRGER